MKIEDLDGFISSITSKSSEEIFGINQGAKFVETDKNIFLADKELIEIRQKIKDVSKLEPEYIGELLFETKNNLARPTPILIEKLSKFSDKKVYVGKDAEWLFLCGKDLFTDSIEKIEYFGAEVRKRDVIDRKIRVKGSAVVFNSKNECLGYGEIINRGMIFLKNKLDKGDYLRREMN